MRMSLALLLIWPLTAFAATVGSPGLDPERSHLEAATDWVQPKAAPVAPPMPAEDPVLFDAGAPPRALLAMEPHRSLALELAMTRTSPWPQAETRGSIWDLPIGFALLLLVMCLMTRPRPRRPLR